MTRNHARCAPHASAASVWACGEGRRLGTEVHAVGESRDVERQSPRAEGLEQSLVGALAALVAGHVQARRVARGVGEEGVEIGRLGLALLVGAQCLRLPHGRRRLHPGGGAAVLGVHPQRVRAGRVLAGAQHQAGGGLRQQLGLRQLDPVARGHQHGGT